MPSLPPLRVQNGQAFIRLPSQQEIEVDPQDIDFDTLTRKFADEEADYVALLAIRRWLRVNGLSVRDLRTASVRQAYNSATYTFTVSPL